MEFEKPRRTPKWPKYVYVECRCKGCDHVWDETLEEEEGPICPICSSTKTIKRKERRVGNKREST